MTRPTGGRLVLRALALVCPRCGRGRMFKGLFGMHPRCAECGLGFEREPGFYLGSIYVNYGLTSLTTTVGYIVLRFGYDISTRTLLIGFSLFCLLFPILFFRHARALWLALDCALDRSTLASENDGPPGDR